MAVELHRLTYRYPAAAGRALDGADLRLEAGLTLLAGASGSGKSTLLRALNGLVPHFHGGRIGGGGLVGGLPVPLTPPWRLARRVGFLFQDPEAQIVYPRVDRDVAFGLENLGVPRAEMRRRVAEALERLAVSHLAGRQVSTLSGGERQRVALAGVLAPRPPVLALDEPLALLDPPGATAAAALIAELAAAGLVVVAAEHRYEDLLPRADRVVPIAGGRLGPAGAPGEVELAAPPQLLRLAAALGWSSPPLSVEAARPRAPKLGRPSPSLPSPPREAGWDLRGAVGPARVPLLEEVDVAGGRGEVVVLVGPNGGGKTSLLRTLAGLVNPLSGRVWRVPGPIAYLPQNPGAVLHRPTLATEVAVGLGRTDRELIEQRLAEMGLPGRGGSDPRDLSGGERQRAAIAALLAGNPALALLDEPTRGMDAAARALTAAAVRRAASAGAAVVMATHDAELAALAGDRILLVESGAVRDLGPPETALSGDHPYATQVGSLYPGGPVTVEGVLDRL